MVKLNDVIQVFYGSMFDRFRQYSGEIEPTKGVQIAKVKDEGLQQELLEAAIAEKLSLAKIKERVAQAKGKTVVDYSQLPTDELETQVRETYKKLSRNKKVWSDPAKRKQIEALLKTLDKLTTA